MYGYYLYWNCDGETYYYVGGLGGCTLRLGKTVTASTNPMFAKTWSRSVQKADAVSKQNMTARGIIEGVKKGLQHHFNREYGCKNAPTVHVGIPTEIIERKQEQKEQMAELVVGLALRKLARRLVGITE